MVWTQLPPLHKSLFRQALSSQQNSVLHFLKIVFSTETLQYLTTYFTLKSQSNISKTKLQKIKIKK